jgi:hypothetical protein
MEGRREVGDAYKKIEEGGVEQSLLYGFAEVFQKHAMELGQLY